MIDNPNPKHWKDLQNGVCRLFKDIGISAVTEKLIKTPRGEITIDVYGVDENSVDQIKYLVECKNWSSAVPQSVVLSFTSTMQEAGGNIGFIVSRKGLQSGAISYTQNTNITGLTYLDMQKRYFDVWWKDYFCPIVAKAADTVNEYVEPFNTYRDRFVDRLSEEQANKFYKLRNHYAAFGMLMWMMDMARIAPEYAVAGPKNIDEYKAKFVGTMGEDFAFKSETYRELLDEMCSFLKDIEKQFNDIFGKNIFDER